MTEQALTSIKRKTLLYQTKVEYGDYTMNHVLGCSHGCKYPCYAYLIAKRFKKVASYEEWIRPQIVTNTIELLQKELPRLAGRISSVQLCFTTDPFMFGYDDICELSVQSIKLINQYDLKCSVLTKGILPADLANLSKENEYGITLISLDENYRKQVEPGAAPYKDRLKALKNLSDKGCYTWVSIEPYPTPNLIEQDINKILAELYFVNKIIFGRCNYNKVVTSYKDRDEFYTHTAGSVIDFCKKNDISYHIKKGTSDRAPHARRETDG